MPTVKLSDVTAGMEIVRPIVHRGRILVHAGAVLTEGMIKALNNWEIGEVEVLTPDHEAEENGSSVGGSTDDAAGMAEEKIRKLFSKTDLQNPVIRELYRLALATHRTEAEASHA